MGNWHIKDTGGTAHDIEDEYGAKVKQEFGVGMPPVRNVVTTYGLTDGGKFQRSIALPREFTLECIVPFGTPVTQANHFSAKKNLIELIKRDRQATEGPVTLRYTGNGGTVEIDAFYQSGLEGGQVTGNTEQFSMQFIAPDPYFKETTQNDTALTPGTALSANHAIRSTGAGSWAAFGTGGGTTTNYVNAIAEDADNIYLGGVFTTWDGSTVNNIVRYDKDNETFHALGSGGTVGVAGTVNTMDIDSGGTVYIGGNFPSAGTVTLNDFTRYHETSDSFEDLGMGASTEVRAISVASDDEVWFCNDGNALLHWDGSTINTVDSENNARSLIVTGGNVVVIGGDWKDGVSTPGGLTSEYLVQYDINTATWSNMNGARGPVYALADGGDDTTLYASSINNNDANGGAIYKWTGTELETLGTTPDTGSTINGCRALAYDPNTNRLYAGGDQTAINGDTDFSLVAYYDFATGTWNDVEVDLQNQVSELKAINYYSPDTSVVFGYENTSGAASVTIPQSTAVSNTGTASANPTITLAGPGDVYKIENTTIDKKLEFSGLTLASGETLTIDLSPGAKSMSTTLRSSVIGLLTSSSDLATFDLLPGSNTINLQTDSTVSGTISWYDTHWSIYGAT